MAFTTLWIGTKAVWGPRRVSTSNKRPPPPTYLGQTRGRRSWTCRPARDFWEAAVHRHHPPCLPKSRSCRPPRIWCLHSCLSTPGRLQRAVGTHLTANLRAAHRSRHFLYIRYTTAPGTRTRVRHHPASVPPTFSRHPSPSAHSQAREVIPRCTVTVRERRSVLKLRRSSLIILAAIHYRISIHSTGEGTGKISALLAGTGCGRQRRGS